ncbi:probable leucine-rich repeat receptor-like protein kinase At5g49770 isoform X2 [Asparagus officinalis]|uniref:probable leucine-rich repeat receptor-like protein kinase At5g49770 isoform X2 n=1 Tax=Asparagus officinalis TaxID=4686 RepID=UPI00098E21E0|nr:probable leucine-rich repeat receptor-like protein kinase At5g49770 isoform X2 [Asparagus officinalis]
MLLLLVLCFVTAQLSSSITNRQDVAALLALMDEMKNTPPNWRMSNDPCGSHWDGVACKNSRVTELKLYSMGLEGTISSDIGSLTELQSLDLSYNKKLGGPLTPAIGKLPQLTTLILIGCSFSGSIPNELGNLPKLTFFHLNQNRLSGSIPEKLFSSNLTVEHILLDRNQLTGSIPQSIGLVQSLTVLRLDNNLLNGSVPSNMSNLLGLNVLNLANNMLTGPLPNLTGLNVLNSVDLSNNSFDPSEAPAWISELGSLTSLMIESGGLHGKVPQELFSFPQLQQVILKDNRFNGSLDVGTNVSPQLKIVDFQNNALTSVELSSNYNNTIILTGNPVCSNFHLSQTSYCLFQQEKSPPYSIVAADCDPPSCPQNYNCSNPYEGVMIFRAPFFRDTTNHSKFQLLRESIWRRYGSSLGSVSLQNPFFDSNSYLQVELKLCPSSGIYFNRTEILMELDLSSQNFTPPGMFGPYYFNASSYRFPGGIKSSPSKGFVVGVIVSCTFLILGLLAVGIYALNQKRRAQKAIEISNPFASWDKSEDTVDAPKLKGARCFSFVELKKCANNFAEINEIGTGGYGKVYRGMLPDGQVVAIKRGYRGSNQGRLEFKTEIELLSRVHHNNLVGLVGFCFQHGERLLVYEYIPNGTLRDCLSGKSGIQLDWKSRLWIALGSARGLAYLHERAYPPIIHRDVKSTNILLDEKLNAKVADFGLSKLVSDGERGHISTQVKGTMGYLDPEYYMTEQLTDKSDVYSFGVVMLELICAKPPIHMGQYIVREVKLAINDKDDEYFGLKDIMDPLLISKSTDVIGFRRFIELALQCVRDSSVDRPTMSYIVKEIERLLQNEGIRTTSSSGSSSDADYRVMKVMNHHSYTDSTQGSNMSSSSFGLPYSQQSSK